MRVESSRFGGRPFKYPAPHTHDQFPQVDLLVPARYWLLYRHGPVGTVREVFQCMQYASIHQNSEVIKLGSSWNSMKLGNSEFGTLFCSPIK